MGRKNEHYPPSIPYDECMHCYVSLRGRLLQVERMSDAEFDLFLALSLRNLYLASRTPLTAYKRAWAELHPVGPKWDNCDKWWCISQLMKMSKLEKSSFAPAPKKERVA